MSYPTPYPPAPGLPQNECLFVVCCADSLKTSSSCSKCCPCFCSTPQVFLQFSRILGSGKAEMVHRTEKVKNTDSSPQWRSFEVTLKQLCGGDKSKEFLIECFQEQQPKFIFSPKSSPKLLGSARTTVAQLQSMGAQSRGVQLQDSKGGHLESSIRFLGFQVRRQNSQVPGQATSFTKSTQQAAPAYCHPANVTVPVPVIYPTTNNSQPSGQPQMMCPPPQQQHDPRPMSQQLHQAHNNIPDTNANAAPQPDSTGAWLDEHFPLHKAVYLNDFKKLAKTLREESTQFDVNMQDTHGNTPLHLAAMLGHTEAVKLLLTHGAKVGLKNNDGWESLHEAISYGDRKIIGILLVAHKRQSHQVFTARLPDIQSHLAQLDDFYTEIKWEVQTWIPLLSRMMPSDMFKVFKNGHRLRIDFTLIDFNEQRFFNWARGNMSLLFDPTAPKGYQTVIMDNQKKVYQWFRDKDRPLEDELDLLMSSDIVSSHMSIRPIQLVRAKNWLMANKSNTIGDYRADLFNIKGMRLITRKRREHLTQEDVKRNKALMQAFSDGKMPAMTADNEHRKSLIAPPRPTLTWTQYLRVPDGPLAHLGRLKHEETNAQEMKGMVALCEDFLLSVDQLLDILQLLEPDNPTVREFRSFCESGRLPPGFPVQLEQPFEGKVYKFQLDKAIDQILGVNRAKGEQLVALVRYDDTDYELVPTSILTREHPDKLIEYYEKHLRFF